MSAQHTPGPLIVDKCADIWANGDGRSGGQCILADVFDAQGHSHSYEAIQNVYLFAASYTSYDKHCGPRAIECAEGDLLGEALGISKDAIDILDVAIDLWNSRYPDEPDEVLTDLQRRCRAVLAKAGGAV